MDFLSNKIYYGRTVLPRIIALYTPRAASSIAPNQHIDKSCPEDWPHGDDREAVDRDNHTGAEHINRLSGVWP
ncbi:hypothetical protein AG1IA_01621 [Rhizoctonia solani AG-1 IA]|uniref:Uncharacterized protein n=1 Tax=Thanatephorus cucumeris (strain AG1-IA) TaxID=983506 RepID=L8X5H8_THACA|nr:hypothetical protein AG1IA_01621 [Rhizoctonia solani AG-1 IA]